MLPPLLKLDSERDYRDHYERTLVNGGPVVLADGTKVYFYLSNFDHAFFGYSNKWDAKKDKFDLDRAERMDWIAYVLLSPSAEAFKDEHSSMRKIRKITLLSSQKYLVVTQVESNKKEIFVTAFPCTDSKAAQVRNSPKWTKK